MWYYKTETNFHDDVIKWKHFPRYWPFVRGTDRSPVNSPHKGQWSGALIFSLICAGTNGCANNRDAGDLRRHRAHYEVSLVVWKCFHGRVLIHHGSILIKSWRNVQCHYQFSTDSCKTPILLPGSKIFSSICTRWYWLVLGPVLLQRSDAVARITANGSAAFNESCTPIG